MNRTNCLWCDARIDDPKELQEHEEIHQNFDFLNGSGQTRGQWFHQMSDQGMDIELIETSEPFTTGFQCEACGKSFSLKSNWKRHQNTAHKENTFSCCKCEAAFSRMDNRNRHENKCEVKKDHVCSECQKCFASSIELARHIEWHNSFENMEPGPSHHNVKLNDLSCSKCGKRFSRKDNKIRHEEKCQGENDHVCHKCQKRCSSAFGLRRHLKWHDKEKTLPEDHIQDTQPGPSQYRCRRCNVAFENRHDLYAHGMREHYQTGGAEMQRPPWEEDDAPWNLDDGTIDQNLRDIYDVNAPHILAPHREGPVSNVYNYPIDNGITIAQLMRYANEIYERQQRAFRLNLVFGVILRNRETGRYRYFVPYNNNGILERPIFISKQSDLTRLRRHLERMDITTELLRQRPDTKWVPVLVSNVHYTVYSTRYPVGNGDLPDYLLHKESMYPLVRNRQTGKYYDDDLCAFRCLALHRGHDIKSIEGPAHEYNQQWVESHDDLEYDDFPVFESFFNVNVEVYSLEEDGFARSIYKSRGKHATTMYVNMYENHLSYIKDFSSYAQKYQCKTCDRHFRRSNDLHRHQRICVNKTKYVYPGGFHQRTQTVFEKLEHGIDVSKEDQTFPWYICYDFESILEQIDDNPTPFLSWTQKHVPISVSICSNVEGCTEEVCHIDTNPDQLVRSMVDTMKDIAFRVYELTEEKWGWTLEALDEILEDEKQYSTEQDRHTEHMLERLYNQMETYMSQVPVLGFNSGKYDLNLVKSYLAKHLNMPDKETKGTFVVKRNNAYMCIASEHLKFLDMSQFLAAGSSYAGFLKAYHVREGKGFFPYQWFDHVDKLEYNELPPHEEFYSSLKNTNISEDDYRYCQQVRNERGMTTFRDFLIWYNNLDVGPFVEAVGRFQQFYFDKSIDVFKTAISVPGIARQLLFRSAVEQNANFALFDRQNSELYQTIKRNIVGGPSIIFTRHHQANVTRIRGKKMCKAILGFDANALYLQAIGQPMPVGPFVVRKEENDFRPQMRDKYMSAYHWMDWLIHSEGLDIQHKLNSGKEVRIGIYPVDGFSPSTTNCFQFQGCYFHGHLCEVTQNVKDKKWEKTREQKYKKTQETTEYLKKRGYKVVEMWECEFRKYCRQNPLIYDFIDSKNPSIFRKQKKGRITEEDILKGVVDGEIFGMVKVDIEVPEEWPSYFRQPTLTPHQYFEEMSPLFCTTDIPFEAFGKHMQEHVKRNGLTKKPRRLLVGGLKGKKLLLDTPLLRWYLNHGLVVTKIYQLIEFQQQRCFKDFVQEVSDARRRGDLDPNTSIIADTMKVIGNSAFGSMIMDKSKHTNVDYVQGENETCLKVNEPRFRKLECLDTEEQYYELEMAKKKIKLDLPIQLGYYVLQYAKLRMLEFYFDFMDRYVSRDDFEYCEMDTDSAYMAVSGTCLGDVIKEDMRQKYEEGLKEFCEDSEIEADDKYHWFPRTCCTKHVKHDKRTPGLFKLEYQGDEMIGLCSKTYIVRKSKVIKPSACRLVAYRLLCRAKGLKRLRHPPQSRHSNEYKFSSKGISKRHVRAPMSIFRGVVKTGHSRSGVNVGFRARNNTIFTYTQERRGFSYFYCKRKVLDDGVHTVPLDITLSPIQEKEDYSTVEG